MGKTLMIIGMVLFVAGVVFSVVPIGRMGRLPGDIVWRAKSWTLFVPITTSVIISLLLTLLVALISRFRQ